MKTSQTDAGRAEKPRRRYDEEFKERAVQLLGEGQRPQRSPARRGGAGGAQLRRQLEHMTRQRDILKKSLEHFQSGCPPLFDMIPSLT